MNYTISILSLGLFFSFEYKRNKLSISATTKKIVKNLKLESIELTKSPLISNPKYSKIEDLCCKPFIMSTAGCPNRTQLENWLKSKGIYNMRYMEFNNLNSIIEGVIDDLGASFVPKSTIEDYEKRGLIKSFSIPPKYNTA